jgi:hypothetical protein
MTDSKDIIPGFVAPPPYHGMGTPSAPPAVAPTVLFRYGWNDLPQVKLPNIHLPKITAKQLADAIDFLVTGIVASPFALAGAGIAVGIIAAIGTFGGFLSFLTLGWATGIMEERNQKYNFSIGMLYILSFVGTFCALYITGTTNEMAAGFSHIGKFAQGNTIGTFISVNFAASLSFLASTLLTAAYTKLTNHVEMQENSERQGLRP